MVRRSRARVGVFLAAGAVIAGYALGSPAPAQADSIAAPHEVSVVPADLPMQAPQDVIVHAGITGFLHRRPPSTEYLWTRYDTGATTVVGDLAGVLSSRISPAGGDRISLRGTLLRDQVPDAAVVLDLSDNTRQVLPIPSGSAVLGAYGTTAVVQRVVDQVRRTELLRLTDAGQESIPITGLPADATMGAGVLTAGDENSFVMPFLSPDGVWRRALVEVATGRAVEIPGSELPPTAPFQLAGDVLAWQQPGEHAVQVNSRSALLAGNDGAGRELALPQVPYRLAIAGDHILAIPVGTIPGPATPVLDVAPDGSHTTLLAQAAYYLGAAAQSSDAAALIIGGSSLYDWAVRRVTANPDGSLDVHAVSPVGGPIGNAGLTISQGLVRHLQTEVTTSTGAQRHALYNHVVVPAISGRGWEELTKGAYLDKALPCAPGAPCVRIVDGNWYGVTYLSTNISHTQVNTGGVSEVLPISDGRIVDVSHGFVVVDSAQTATQYVIEAGWGAVVRSGPVHGAALWYNTLWTPGAVAGQIAAIDLATKSTVRTVSTGSACVPSELQAAARWLYWSCGASAGVVDLQRGVNIPLPSADMLLGDGYVVWRDTAAGVLRMFDFHTGVRSADPVTVAAVPPASVPDDRGLGWAVDKFGGYLAYVDESNAVHVVDTGVPASPPGLGARWWSSGEVYPRSTDRGNTWAESLVVTRPVSSWRLTITRASTKQVVATRTGGATRVEVTTTWDGRLPTGALAPSGRYLWSLSAVGLGSSTTVTLESGEVAVKCGAVVFRSYDCDGRPALLGVRSNTYGGEAHWYTTTSSGALRDNGYTERWPRGTSGSGYASAIVPFGDVNGDGNGDLLVRDGTGVLRAYLGIGQTDYAKETTKSIRIGSGWNMYTALAAPGDLNADGKPDLIGRDTSGRLWLYAGTGTGGFRTRVSIGTGWNTYVRLIGAGDLTGDGRGELLAVDKAGVMWRYNGNGRGGFIARVRVGSGWGVYNAIIGIGDLNQDGRNDLLGRDSAGNLWLYPGRGNGTFNAKVKTGTGWNRYAAIF